MSRVTLGLSGLFGGLALGACSLITEFGECQTDQDCVGAGAGFVCGADKQCVPGAGTTTGDSSSSATTVEPTTSATASTGPGSTTIDETTGGTTEAITSSSSSGGGPVACTKHSECVAAFDEDHLCGKAGECVSALTTECQQLVWPDNKPSDKVVFLGSVMTTTPPFDTLVVPLQNAVQLAVEDFNNNTDLPGGYKIAWIACDDKGTLENATAAATHLTDVVGTPAIVGPVFSELVIGLAPHAKTTGTLFMSPTATAKSISTLDDDGLVWRTISSDVYQANALADRIPLMMPTPKKVAIMYKDDAYGNGLLMDTYARLMAKAPGIKVATQKYPNPVTLPPDQLMNAYATAIASAWGAMGQHPDTIVLIGTTEVTDLILGFMLAASAENPPPVPRFVVSHGAVPALPAMVEKAGMPAVQQALIAVSEGVAPVIFDPMNFANFNVRYKIRFNDQEPITASSLSYDSAMVVMFGMAGVPDGMDIDGKNIAATISRMVDKMGTAVSFGEVMPPALTFIKKARNILVTGGTVDLRGVSGELDFDLKVGEVRTNVLGWGLDPDANDMNVGVLDPKRMYVLNPVPATDGTWMDLP